jgi:hypothetical protein
LFNEIKRHVRAVCCPDNLLLLLCKRLKHVYINGTRKQLKTRVNMEQRINKLTAVRFKMSSIDESLLLRPANAQSDKEFEAFVHTKRCPVCLGVPRYPASIKDSKCGHEGCMPCLNGVEKCPVGRCCKVEFEDLLVFSQWPHRAKVSFNQDLLVKCGECDVFKSGTVAQLFEHEMRECPKRIVRCLETLCYIEGTPEEVLTHYRQEHEQKNTEAKLGSIFDGEVVTMQDVSRWDSQRNDKRLFRKRVAISLGLGSRAQVPM